MNSIRWIAGLTICALLFCGRGQAQNVGWSDAYRYGAGYSVAVAVYGATVIEVNEAGPFVPPLMGRPTLHYRIGQITGSGVQWGNDVQYDVGFHPKVALHGSTVVEVHGVLFGGGPLIYRVGQLISGPRIVWGDSVQYDDLGETPAVALNDSTLIEVHRNPRDGLLYYRVGRVYGWLLQWLGGAAYDYGDSPAVAADAYVGQSASGIHVIEVHKSGSPSYYRVGVVAGSSIQWGNSVAYDTQGNHPAIALHGTSIIETHNIGDYDGWYRRGEVHGTAVQWESDYPYETTFGLYLGIGVGLTFIFPSWEVVEVHIGSAYNPDLGLWESGRLFSRVGTWTTLHTVWPPR